MSNCANCGSFACRQGQPEKAPDRCPMHDHEALYKETMAEYQKDEVNNIARHAAIVEAAGYRLWTRLEEIIEFGLRAGVFLSSHLRPGTGKKKVTSIFLI